MTWGHFTLDHMYVGMQEHEPTRTNMAEAVWIEFGNNLNSTLIFLHKVSKGWSRSTMSLCFNGLYEKIVLWGIRNKNPAVTHWKIPVCAWAIYYVVLACLLNLHRVCNVRCLLSMRECSLPSCVFWARLQSPVTPYRVNRILTAHTAYLSLCQCLSRNPQYSCWGRG